MKIPLKYLASIPMGLVLVAAWVYVKVLLNRRFPEANVVMQAIVLTIPMAVAIWAMFSVLYRINAHIERWKADRKIRKYFKITPLERWK